MRKFLFAALVVILLIETAVPAFADKLSLNPVNPGEWTIWNSGGAQVGTLKSLPDGGYSLLTGSGRYLGAILKTGELQSNIRYQRYTPEEAQLYLDVLEAIKSLKQQKDKPTW